MEQGHPGTGRPFTASLLLLNVYLKQLLILLFANLFASTLTGECGFYALFLAGLQVKGVALYLLDNVFLLHLAFKTPQCVLEGLTLLQSDFRQTKTPPNASRWTE
jgi:hypothetical protein